MPSFLLQEISTILTAVGEYYSKAGGSAANTTRGLASLGVRAALVSSARLCCSAAAFAVNLLLWIQRLAVCSALSRCSQLGARGYDEWGALWASSMKRGGVDISMVQARAGPTGRCCILSCRGTRTMRTCMVSCPLACAMACLCCLLTTPSGPLLAGTQQD